MVIDIKMQQQLHQRAATPTTKSAQSPSPKAQAPIRRRARLHSLRRSLTKERPLPVPEVQQADAGSGHPGLCRLGASASPPSVSHLQVVEVTVSIDMPPCQKGMELSEDSPTLSSKTCTAQANGSRSTSVAPYEDPANDPRQYRRRGRRPKLTRALETSNSYTQCANDQAILQQHDSMSNVSPSSVHANGTPGVWLCVYQQQPGQSAAQVYMHHQALTPDIWQQLQPSQRPHPIMTIDHKLSFLRCTEKQGPWHNYYIQFDGDGSLLEEDIMFPNRVVLLEKRPPALQPPPMQKYTISSWALPSAGAAANHLASLFQPTAHPQPTHQPGFGHNATPAQLQRMSQRTPSPAFQQLSTSLYNMLGRDASTTRQTKAEESWQTTASPMLHANSNDGSSMWTVQRTRHDYRGIHDIVLWLADPTDASIRAHLVNLIRCGMSHTPPTASRLDTYSDWEPPSHKNVKPEWIYTRLVATWGKAALLDLKFTRNAVARLTCEAGLLLGTMASTHSPSPPRLQLHYRESIDMQLAAHARLQSVGG